MVQKRQPLHLIKDHQLVGAGFQIEIEAGGGGGQLQGQRGFAHLTGTEQSHGRKLLQPAAQQRVLKAGNPARLLGPGPLSLQISHNVTDLQVSLGSVVA